MDEKATTAGTPAKPSWDEIVKNSNGTRFFLNSQFEEEAKKGEESRQSLRKEGEKMAKVSIMDGVAAQNLFLKIREQLEKDGVEGVWVKDIGFDEGALKEGKFVVNLTEPQRQ